MLEESGAELAIHRAPDGLGLFRLEVLVDGERVGRLKNGRGAAWPVAAGVRSLGLRLGGHAFGPIPLEIEAGDRVTVRCRLNQPPLHPLHLHAFWFLIAFAILKTIGDSVPAVDAFLRRHLVVELLVMLALGSLGMFLYFREAIRSGGLRGTRMYLDVESEAGGVVFREWIDPSWG
ncbi:hypothetical protein OJF2_78050 [Aquisphaera giovannonii]|uniref:Uncharacterized protein n=1 Tax=Aquisphaera giovannonii TaxID=406548 RepID=A0A5B9WFD9_9BACT|nr:hypothetical protein [Aquisphaera giovannonii]QEH39193.1 hypothetical protein OJF2_78050 [Aquisphaera giovannonii]